MATSNFKITYVACIIFVLVSTELESWQKRWMDLKFILEINLTDLLGMDVELKEIGETNLAPFLFWVIVWTSVWHDDLGETYWNQFGVALIPF